MFTQVGVKQLTDFLRTVTAASDLVHCTLVNCEYDAYLLHCDQGFGMKKQKKRKGAYLMIFDDD